MSIVSRVLSSVTAFCVIAVSLQAAEKVVFSYDKNVQPLVKFGKVMNDAEGVTVVFPFAMKFQQEIKVKTGCSYTVTAEMRSVGKTGMKEDVVHGGVWIGFLDYEQKINPAQNRISKAFAEVIAPVKVNEDRVLVKGNLDSWYEISDVPLLIAVGAKEDNSDLPNINLVRIAANGITKTQDGNWQIKFSRFIQQNIDVGTKLALHYYCRIYSFMPEKKATNEWTTLSGTFKADADTASSLRLAICGDDAAGSVEIRNIKVVETGN